MSSLSETVIEVCRRLRITPQLSTARPKARKRATTTKTPTIALSWPDVLSYGCGCSVVVTLVVVAVMGAGVVVVGSGVVVA